MRIEVCNYSIEISDSVFDIIKPFIQMNNENESGGILFGQKIEGKNEYHIVGLTTPNKSDKSSRFSFVRNAKNAQKVISKKWKDTSGYVNYIGEWHTHPERNPKPSSIDLKTYETISLDGSSLYPISINIIFGNTSSFFICGYSCGSIIFEEVVNYE